MRWVRPIVIGLVVLAAAIPRAHGVSVAPAGQVDKTRYRRAFEKARQLLQRQEYFEALKGFQRANQIAGGRSGGMFCRHGAGDARHEDLAERRRDGADGDRARGERALLRRPRTHCQRDRVPVARRKKTVEAARRRARVPAGARGRSRVEGRRSAFQPRRGADEADARRGGDCRVEQRAGAEGQRLDGGRRARVHRQPRRARENYAPDFSVSIADGRPNHARDRCAARWCCSISGEPGVRRASGLCRRCASCTRSTRRTRS